MALPNTHLGVPDIGITFLVLISSLIKADVQWKVDFLQRLAFGRAFVFMAMFLHVRKCFNQFPNCGCMHAHQHQSSRSLRLSHSLADGNENLCPAELCEGEWASVCVCVCWANSYQTGAETLHLLHHLHRPFPACRVIPAPAFPPLPSHTYQPPAAVPLPELSSSSLDSMDKRKQLIRLSLSLSFCVCLFLAFFLKLSKYSVARSVILTPHLISFPHTLLNCTSRASAATVSRRICTKSLPFRAALPGCYSTSLKPPIIIKGYVGWIQNHSLSTISLIPIFRWDRYAMSVITICGADLISTNNSNEQNRCSIFSFPPWLLK